MDIGKLGELWCMTMHSSITWPRGGTYQCRTCGRLFAVPWIEQENYYARQAPPVQAPAPVSAALPHGNVGVA